MTPRVGPTEVLVLAREIVSAGWTQEASARDEAGKVCSVEHGVEFCALGAIAAATRRLLPASPYCWLGMRGGASSRAASLLWKAIPGGEPWCSVARYNDARGRTKEEIISLFDRAIELAR